MTDAHAIRGGRHAEAQATHERYYALNPQPNFRQFRTRRDPASLFYRDAAGREYKLGPVDREHDTRTIYVRLPRADVPWFDADPGLPNAQVTVRPEAGGSHGHTWSIVYASLQARHRTGFITVVWT